MEGCASMGTLIVTKTSRHGHGDCPLSSELSLRLVSPIQRIQPEVSDNKKHHSPVKKATVQPGKLDLK